RSWCAAVESAAIVRRKVALRSRYSWVWRTFHWRSAQIRSSSSASSCTERRSRRDRSASIFCPHFSLRSMKSARLSFGSTSERSWTGTRYAPASATAAAMQSAVVLMRILPPGDRNARASRAAARRRPARARDREFAPMPLRSPHRSRVSARVHRVPLLPGIGVATPAPEHGEHAMQTRPGTPVAVAPPEPRAPESGLAALFAPRAVAVVGASRSPLGVGHLVLKKILDGGYRGLVYPVNPRAQR